MEKQEKQFFFLSYYRRIVCALEVANKNPTTTTNM